MTKRAFSLLEIMIVVSVLGILAAIVMPKLQSESTKAKETAAKDNLRILRSAIEVYTVQHKDVPPGYPNGDTSSTPLGIAFSLQLIKATNSSGQTADPGTAGYDLGPYLSNMPANPFNKSKTTQILADNADLPDAATGTYGWIYKPATKEIRIDWPGTDSQGMAYYDY